VSNSNTGNTATTGFVWTMLQATHSDGVLVASKTTHGVPNVATNAIAFDSASAFVFSAEK
jgi:hypothetical protein